MTISQHDHPKILSLKRIGTLLMYLYILMSFVAQDIVISSRFASLSLYAFVGFTLLKEVFSLKGERTLSAFSLWYFLFALFSLIIMLYAPEQQFLSGTFYSTVVCLIVVWAVKSYMSGEKDFRGLSWCFALSGAAAVFLLFVTGNLKGSAEDRLGQDTFGNANTFASLMMIAAMFALWLAIYTRGPKRIIPIIFFLVDMYALALSSSRSFFIIPLVFLYLLLLFKRDRQGKLHILRSTLFVAALLLVIFIAITRIPVLYNAIGIRMEGLWEVFSGSGNGESSAMIRENMRSTAFTEWAKAPFFGYGLNSFKFYAKDLLGVETYSHCNYTELLFSGGIFYFLFYYSMFGKIAITAFKKKALATPYRAYAITTCLSLLVFDYGAVSFNLPHILIMLMLAYKCLSFQNGENKNE